MGIIYFNIFILANNNNHLDYSSYLKDAIRLIIEKTKIQKKMYFFKYQISQGQKSLISMYLDVTNVLTL